MRAGTVLEEEMGHEVLTAKKRQVEWLPLPSGAALYTCRSIFQPIFSWISENHSASCLFLRIYLYRMYFAQHRRGSQHNTDSDSQINTQYLFHLRILSPLTVLIVVRVNQIIYLNQSFTNCRLAPIFSEYRTALG